MEDASGVDLDWFWRGWFFETDAVDIGIEKVRYLKLDDRTPLEKKQDEKYVREKDESYISRDRNMKDIETTYLEQDSTVRDFYNEFDRFEVFPEDEANYQRFMESLTSTERELLDKKWHFYEITFIYINISYIVLLFN